MHRTRVLRPAEGVLAFYDGREDGYRFAEADNWVDEGAIELGIASYAIVDGDEALVYDTHVSIEHGRFVRAAVEAEGATKLTVVLSHWHLDHVAGTEAFADCEVIANERTAELLAANRAAIEAGEHEGPPAIDPLVMPTRTFSGRERIEVGDISVELIEAQIHSSDATLLWLADRKLLFAGDAMEDTVTYVTEPDALETHIAELDRIDELRPERILPCHGDPGVIAAGGYSRGLIRATQQYVRALRRCRDDEGLRATPLRELIAGPLDAEWIHYYEPYESVHRENLESVLGESST